MDKAPAKYQFWDVILYAIDEDGNELKNNRGELRTFVQRGMGSGLDYLIEEINEDLLEEIK